MDSDGWEAAKKTVRRPTADRRNLRVVLDLQTLDFDSSFQPKFLRMNIANAVEEVTTDRFNCSEVRAYVMVEPDEECQRNMRFLGKFCDIIKCCPRKLSCRVCKGVVAHGKKQLLSELEIIKDAGELALSQRNRTVGKSAFFIASGDDFFNVDMAQELVSQGFDVYTGRVQGMIRKPMYRDMV